MDSNRSTDWQIEDTKIPRKYEKKKKKREAKTPRKKEK